MFFLVSSEEILYYVCGFGIVQGFLLAALIYFHPKSDRSVTTFLALHIFFVTVLMVLPFILIIFSWQRSFFIQPMPFLVGPLLFLYLQSFRKRISWRTALPHFIPFFVFFFLAYWNISNMAAKYPDATTLPGEALNSTSTRILIYLRLSHLLLYYFLSRRSLKKYQDSIKHLFSETSTISLHWAKVMINGYLCLFIAVFIVFQIMFRYPEQINTLLFINTAFSTVYIYVATFKGIAQPTLWQARPDLRREEIEQEMEEAGELQAKPALVKSAPVVKEPQQDRITEIAKKITALMEEDKIYQETELSVQQLASRLDLPTYQVSQAINDGLNRNFYDLVNSYRVAEAKKLLQDPRSREFTILSVGFEAGFNSKTTFNTVFKKFTGLTPTEYRDQKKQPAA